MVLGPTGVLTGVGTPWLSAKRQSRGISLAEIILYPGNEAGEGMGPSGGVVLLGEDVGQFVAQSGEALSGGK